MIFIFQFVNMVWNTDWFVDTKKYLYPWDKSHLIMVYDPFNILLKIFAFMFISDVSLQFFFSDIFIWF